MSEGSWGLLTSARAVCRRIALLESTYSDVAVDEVNAGALGLSVGTEVECACALGLRDGSGGSVPLKVVSEVPSRNG